MKLSTPVKHHRWLPPGGDAFWASFVRRRTAVWLAFLVLSAGAAVAEAPVEETETTEAEKVSTPSFVGLRAFIDPETGELTSTPTPEQLEALSQAMEQQSLANAAGPLSRSSVGLEPFELATGGRGVHLGKRFQSALVVRRVAEGELELVCRDDASGTHHEHAVPATAPTEWAEK